MNYAQKLLDPRWQRKSAEIKMRDNFTCMICGDTKTTLHVHHSKYIGSNPWDTPDKFLITLCKACHKIEHMPKREPIETAEPKERVQIIITESQLIDYDFKSNKGLPPAVKHHYLSLLNWIANYPDDLEFINYSKCTLSEYCHNRKVILIAVNGDVYGEGTTVKRYS